MFKNTKEYFKEYMGYLKTRDHTKIMGSGFQLPLVISKDFKSMTKKQLIIVFVVIIGFSGIVSELNHRLTTQIEQQTLLCDCSMERENDHYYFFWYNVGLQYGERIPQLVNVSRNLDDQSQLGKRFFTTSWIKDWIYKNGGQNIGGVPKTEKYLECWEKGFLNGRNNYLEQ